MRFKSNYKERNSLVIFFDDFHKWRYIWQCCHIVSIAECFAFSMQTTLNILIMKICENIIPATKWNDKVDTTFDEKSSHERIQTSDKFFCDFLLYKNLVLITSEKKRPDFSIEFFSLEWYKYYLCQHFAAFHTKKYDRSETELFQATKNWHFKRKAIKTVWLIFEVHKKCKTIFFPFPKFPEKYAHIYSATKRIAL